MRPELIAPCGMNCMLCSAYLRAERSCPGCRSRDKKCGIRNCPIFRKSRFRYCYLCDKFPCARIKRLDKRYSTRYGMSMIENLEFIRRHGMARFLAQQKRKWLTPEGVICVHDRKVYKLEC